MPAIDNALYDRDAATWRDEQAPLSLLVPLTPPRVAYARGVLAGRLGLALDGLAVLDVGCGGGLVAEELARLGCRVTGVDPSAPSLETARAHAARVGLAIDYRLGSGEHLPCADAAFAVVCCLDVLEHVVDPHRVIAEVARVLRPGGVFVFDTINRTCASKVVAIKLAQEWRWTRFLGPHVHVWERFITPEELRAMLARRGLAPREIAGATLTGNPVRLLWMIRRLKRGAITYGELGRYLAARVRLGPDTSIAYLGYALKPR